MRAPNVFPGVKGARMMDPIPRFWANIEKTGDQGCWVWTGSTTSIGYGVISVNGKRMRAHRFAWEMHHGKPFPDGMHGCHSCDNPPCCNPLHIFPGTRSDNMQDSIRKGRASTFYSSKTHCKQGHEYSDANTYTHAGKRQCRLCQKRNRRASEARQRSSRDAV